MSSPLPAANWFPDPTTPGQLRWWTGVAWSDHVQPALVASPPVIPQPRLGDTTWAGNTTGAASSGQPGVASYTHPVPGAQPQSYVNQVGITHASAGPTDPRFATDHIVVKQRVRLGVHVYDIENQQGQRLGFVRQKRLTLRDRISFRANDQTQDSLMELTDQRRLGTDGVHLLTDAHGQTIGTLRKNRTRSLVRSTWHVLDAQGQEVAWVQEHSLALALWRRYGSLVPFADLLEIIPIPYQFDIHAGSDRAGGPQQRPLLGTYRRRFGLRDHYDMDLTGDPQRTIDRRIAVGLAIALDALQRR